MNGGSKSLALAPPPNVVVGSSNELGGETFRQRFVEDLVSPFYPTHQAVEDPVKSLQRSGSVTA